MTKVSVLMSVYNGEPYLREAVESILKQTFRDFDFVIVDDGSTDNAWQILTAYAAQDSRIVLIRNEENIGLDRSLNKGLMLTRGKYIARQDADDVSLPDRLMLQTNLLDSHPEIGALGTAVENIDEQGISLGKHHVPLDHASLQARLLMNNCFHHSSMMIRQSLLQKLGGYDERMRYVEDYDLWWRLSGLARIANLPDVLVCRRRSGGSVIRRYRQQMLKAALEISLKAVRESLKGRFLDEETYKRFWWAYHTQYEQLEGVNNRLQPGDIKRLQPFWDLLATYPAGPQIWGPRLRTLAHNLLRCQQTDKGVQLLWVVAYRLTTPILWRPTLKSFVEPYVPVIGQRFWRTWQLKRTGT